MAVLKKTKTDTGKAEPKGSLSRLLTAKFIVVFLFGFVLLLVMTEVVAMGCYGLPYVLTWMAQNVGVTSGADWVIGGILWAFPALFVTILLALAHWVVIKKIVGKMWRWMFAVLKKTV